MKSFQYTIKDPQGVHARPAGIIVQEAKKYQSTVTVDFNGKKADMKRIFAVMALCIKAGNTITVEVNGPDEVNAAAAVEAAFKKNL